jgi:hypothetical protein
MRTVLVFEGNKEKCPGDNDHRALFQIDIGAVGSAIEEVRVYPFGGCIGR